MLFLLNIDIVCKLGLQIQIGLLNTFAIFKCTVIIWSEEFLDFLLDDTKKPFGLKSSTLLTLSVDVEQFGR